MQHQDWADAEAAALDRLLSATATLLDRLRATRDPAERGVLGVEFEARVADLREDLERRGGLDARSAAAVITRALARVAELVRETPRRA